MYDAEWHVCHCSGVIPEHWPSRVSFDLGLLVLGGAAAIEQDSGCNAEERDRDGERNSP